jgi:TolB-like protein/Tfp pilus assembly protein PilF/predicted Ser/Thr protein kinase
VDDSGKTSLVGRTLAHYRISTVIGAGGMGEVYRATDTKLGRDVALKVLPSDMARDPDRLARFQREARAVAALNHPNVVTVYSVEESDNIHFITMELIEGQPLDRLISGNGLPEDRIIEIAGAIAEALAAAHEKGIVHRDLKPANVMVTNEGRVKVLDFGLAKDVGAETANDETLTSAGRTQAGMVMGTPAYMSPEQVSGRPLDHRSDIFSLGVVLHEMATGRRPFEGSSSAELISSILRDTPPPVNQLRPELPADLARVIRRCLEKDPRYRMQTARDVSNEFRDMTRTTTPSTPLSKSPGHTSVADSGAARADEGFWVAVLPFKYSGSNADLTALAEGLTEEIVTNMSKFSYLRVIARGSTAQYAQRAVDVRTAAKELGARYVMEGSIRLAGTKIRIAVQLVDSSSGAGLWAETYDRVFTPDATLDLLDDVVPRIVATVGDTQGVLAHSMTDALRNRDPQSLTPYEAVLRSHGYHQLVTAAEHLAGITALEHAVKQAPDRADCWAMLAWLYRGEFTHGFNPRPDPLGRSLAAARRAIEADPSNPIAHAALASALFCRRDLAAFRTAAQRALALNRLEGYATAYLGLQIAFAGDWEQGCALAERATQLNPNHPGWYWLPLAINAYRGHESQRALEYALKVNMPGLWTAQFTLSVIYSQLGQMEQARSALREVLVLRPDFAATAREELGKWWLPDMVEQMLGDLRKAGLGAPQALVAPLPPTGTAPARTGSGEKRADEGFWVAVLPFKHKGSGPNLDSLAEGLVEEIITGLSRFSYMRVISRGSVARYAGETADVRDIGKELSARYVLEGNLRQADTRLRVTVQLLDTSTGAHLWAETYDRVFQPNAVFDLQDELVPKIVSTTADAQGVLPRNMGESLRSRRAADLTPYEAVLRSFAYLNRISAEEHRTAREALEQAVERAPDYAPAWAMLSIIVREEYTQGFNPRPAPLERADAAARRAVEIAPSDNLGFQALAAVQFLRREFSAFRASAERALGINPMDGFTLAYLGFLLAYAGDWERGCALCRQARSLNPHHPGWFWFAEAFDAFRQGNYREALAVLAKINMPHYWRANLALAASYGHLGELEAARSALGSLLAAKPDFAAIARAECEKWWQPAVVEQMLDGLRKAGLEVSSAGAAPTALSGPIQARTASGESRADGGFWVAVLPFKYTGGSAELKALAEGLSEEIITGLSRFSYLRVIARGSTAKYSSESGDIRAIAKELGARYVMEGSLRQAGSKLRLAIQLVEATTGAHLWAETYERGLKPEAIFELQDDLVPRVVSTVADMNGALPRSMSQMVRDRDPEQLTPYEAVLRSFCYLERATPEELTAARSGLEAVVRKVPSYADAWAMLSFLCCQDYAQGFDLRADALEIATSAARKAVELGPSNHLAYFGLAQAQFFQKEVQSFRNAAERAVALNSMDGNTLAFMGELMVYAGDQERGMDWARRAKQLNPGHPGWYWFVDFYNAYRQGDDRAALKAALNIQLPGHYATHFAVAAAYGQLGEEESARKAVRELLKLRPNFSKTLRKDFEKWWVPEYVERLVDGLRKAGLEVPATELTSLPGNIPRRTGSGEIRAAEGFWVAVLPFKCAGNNQDLRALAEGLSEEVITGLSRFSYLRVIARGSTAMYTSEAGDVRAVGKELGARYVMEGSLRQAGNKVRLSVQLVDTASGAHLWAETYERPFQAEALFDLHDELVPRIVSTVADQDGILPLSMAEALRNKSDDQLTPHEAMARSFGFFKRLTPEEHAKVRQILETAVRKSPDHGDCWAMLSHLYCNEYWAGFNTEPDPLGRALEAARRAVDAAPSNHLSYWALALALYLRRDKDEFRTAAERAIELNPMDGSSVAFMGALIAYSGDWERGCTIAERASALNPNHAGWHKVLPFYNAFRKGEYREALASALRLNAPGSSSFVAARAAAYGQLGELEAAQKAVKELCALDPAFATIGREFYSRFLPAPLVERLIDGLRRAGLNIPSPDELPPAAKEISSSGATQ